MKNTKNSKDGQQDPASKPGDGTTGSEQAAQEKPAGSKKTAASKKKAVPKKRARPKKKASTKKKAKPNQPTKPAGAGGSSAAKPKPEKKTGVLISVTAYARHRKEKGLTGHTHQAVGKAIKTGRLLKCLEEKNGKKYIKDAEAADLEWAEKTIPPTDKKDDSPDEDQAHQINHQYTGARARRQDAQAEIAEMERDKLKGNLIDKQKARQQLSQIGSELVSTMKSFTRTSAARLARITDEHEMRIVLDEIFIDAVAATAKKIEALV